jgi:HPt (histidine-containing phosphotransfer) domain-containing protein
LTAGAFKAQHDAAEAVGMTHFISKPFDVPSTIALIQRLCHRPAPETDSEAALAEVPRSEVGSLAGGNAVMDVALGLKLWLDRPSYQEFLQHFVDVHGHTVGAVRQSLALGDLPQAQGLAHKLSGVAANLALPEVRRLAAQVEGALVSGLDPTEALLQLERAVQLVLIEIERFLASAE